MTHGEAFKLMRYRCEDALCGHTETLWNSRDGVTPYCIGCPSCGGLLQHKDWGRDAFAPEHKPHREQRVFVDRTRERAEQGVARYMNRLLADGQLEAKRATDELRESLIEDWLRGGHAPDIRVSDGNGGFL